MQTQNSSTFATWLSASCKHLSRADMRVLQTRARCPKDPSHPVIKFVETTRMHSQKCIAHTCQHVEHTPRKRCRQKKHRPCSCSQNDKNCQQVHPRHACMAHGDQRAADTEACIFSLQHTCWAILDASIPLMPLAHSCGRRHHSQYHASGQHTQRSPDDDVW